LAVKKARWWVNNNTKDTRQLGPLIWMECWNYKRDFNSF
jgi:hypothetical protein